MSDEVPDASWEALRGIAREMQQVTRRYDIGPGDEVGRAFLHCSEQLDEAIRRRDMEAADQAMQQALLMMERVVRSHHEEDEE